MGGSGKTKKGEEERRGRRKRDYSRKKEEGEGKVRRGKEREE